MNSRNPSRAFCTTPACLLILTSSSHVIDSPVEGQIPGVIHANLPKLVRIGPAWFRRKVAEMVPRPFAQRMLRISDVMHAQSVRIIKEKRAALERGDEALKQQVGEGKDLMSVLCE